MKQILFFVATCFLSYRVFAQTKTVDVYRDDASVASSYFTVSGEPFVNTKFVRLTEGSPYFKDEWLRGFLILEKNSQYKGLLKLDLYGNEVHYQDAKGNDFVVTLPIKKIILIAGDAIDTFVHASHLPPNAAKAKTDWYQLLYADSVILYKYYLKELSENKLLVFFACGLAYLSLKKQHEQG